MSELPDPLELLTPLEVAKRLKVSVRTLARWSARGVLRAVVLPNGQRRYRVADIEAILSEPTVAPPTDDLEDPEPASAGRGAA